jgi:hypothetical protein
VSAKRGDRPGLTNVPAVQGGFGLSARAILALSGLHSAVRQLRDIDDDRAFLAALLPDARSPLAERALDEERQRHTRAVADALAELEAALAAGKGDGDAR